jgi:hypothetical protein
MKTLELSDAEALYLERLVETRAELEDPEAEGLWPRLVVLNCEHAFRLTGEGSVCERCGCLEECESPSGAR